MIVFATSYIGITSGYFKSIFSEDKYHLKDHLFWNRFFFYKNEKITTFYDVNFNMKCRAYGDWKRIDQRIYKALEGGRGIEIGDLAIETEIINDSSSVDIKKRVLTEKGWKDDESKCFYSDEGKIDSIQATNKTIIFYRGEMGLIKRVDILKGEDLVSWTLYMHDKKSRLAKITAYNQEDGNKEWELEYSYDWLGNIEKREHSTNHATKPVFSDVETNTFGVIEKREYEYKDGYRTEKTVCIVPSEGCKNSVSKFDKAGNEVLYENLEEQYLETIEYKYDSFGNWISRAVYENGRAIWVTLRKISYKNGEVTGTLDLDNFKTSFQ
jgi:hypothetical protein